MKLDTLIDGPSEEMQSAKTVTLSQVITELFSFLFFFFFFFFFAKVSLSGAYL